VLPWKRRHQEQRRKHKTSQKATYLDSKDVADNCGSCRAQCQCYVNFMCLAGTERKFASTWPIPMMSMIIKARLKLKADRLEALLATGVTSKLESTDGKESGKHVTFGEHEEDQEIELDCEMNLS
jgi:hypothetical protein